MHSLAARAGSCHLEVSSEQAEVVKRDLHCSIPNADSPRLADLREADPFDPLNLGWHLGNDLRFHQEALARAWLEVDSTMKVGKWLRGMVVLSVCSCLDLLQPAVDGFRQMAFGKANPFETPARLVMGRGNLKGSEESCRCSHAELAEAESLEEASERWGRPETRILGRVGLREKEGVEMRSLRCEMERGMGTWAEERIWMGMSFECRSAGWRCWPEWANRV